MPHCYHDRMDILLPENSTLNHGTAQIVRAEGLIISVKNGSNGCAEMVRASHLPCNRLASNEHLDEASAHLCTSRIGFTSNVIYGLGIHFGPDTSRTSSCNSSKALSVELNHNIWSGKFPQHLETVEAEHLSMGPITATLVCKF